MQMGEYARRHRLDGDWFAAACALHWYAIDHLPAPEAAALLARLGYRPDPLDTRPLAGTPEARIHAALVEGVLLPVDVLEWISADYRQWCAQSSHSW